MRPIFTADTWVWFGSLNNSVRAVAALTGIGQFVGSAELLIEPILTRPNGLMDWRFIRLRYPVLASRWFSSTIRPLFGIWSSRPITFVKCAAAAHVAGAAIFDHRITIPLIELILADLLLAIRLPLVFQGADNMMRVTTWALAIGMLGGTQWLVASIYFVSLHSILAYATAGLAKWAAPEWWNGTALREIVATEMYGNARVSRFLRKAPPIVSVGLSVAVLFGEPSFVLALLLPIKGTITLLLFGAAFHALMALLMGLNLFVWAFVATYPAILFCQMHLHQR